MSIVISLMIAFTFVSYMVVIGVPKTKARNAYNKGELSLERRNNVNAKKYFEEALDHWNEKYIREEVEKLEPISFNSAQDVVVAILRQRNFTFVDEDIKTFKTEFAIPNESSKPILLNANGYQETFRIYNNHSSDSPNYDKYQTIPSILIQEYNFVPGLSGSGGVNWTQIVQNNEFICTINQKAELIDESSLEFEVIATFACTETSEISAHQDTNNR